MQVTYGRGRHVFSLADNALMAEANACLGAMADVCAAWSESWAAL